MKSDKIRDAIIDIDDDLIEGADKKMTNNNKGIWFKWGSVAAAFVIVAGGVFALSGAFKKTEPESVSPETSVISTEKAVVDDKTTNASAEATKANVETTKAKDDQGEDEGSAYEIDLDFEFNGKTIRQYTAEYEGAWLAAAELEVLVKEGKATEDKLAAANEKLDQATLARSNAVKAFFAEKGVEISDEE